MNIEIVTAIAGVFFGVAIGMGIMFFKYEKLLSKYENIIEMDNYEKLKLYNENLDLKKKSPVITIETRKENLFEPF